MSPLGFAIAGLRGFRGAHAATAAGVATATAVLVGALVVGDSVRGSLRDLTLQRLGRYEQAVAPGAPFRAMLAPELAARGGFADRFEAVEPLWIAPASLGAGTGGERRYASGAQLVGCDPSFWLHGEAPPGHDAAGGVLLTAPLAEELGVEAGDNVVVRTARSSMLPGDSPLGERDDATASRRWRVAAVLEPRGLARFALAPSQQASRSVFAPLAEVQRLVGAKGEANTIVAAARAGSAGDPPGAAAWLAENLRPLLADYGLSFESPRDGVWQLESRALVVAPAVVDAARRALGADRVQPVTTYLANAIRLGAKTIPYSTVAGVDSTAALGPLLGSDGAPIALADDEIALGSWAAEDLGASVGDVVTITYYEPESTHGEPVEAPPVSLRVAAIAPLEDSQGSPTPAADARLTPRLEGVTDAASIGDWDVPFPLVEQIRPQDEAYWDQRRATPKAFVSHALAARLWGSRWGTESLLRVAAGRSEGERFASALRDTIDPSSLGFAPRPILAQGLAASTGSTPFDVLFLLFSMFLIVSALALVALLAALGVESRSGEVGLLGAVGYSRAEVRRHLLRELLAVASLGAIVGAGVGAAYAALLVRLLGTVWVDAIVTPFVTTHLRPLSIGAGAAAGLLVAMLAIWVAVRQATAQQPRALLAGSVEAPTRATRRRGSSAAWAVVAAALGAAAAAGLAGRGQRGEAAAGAFLTAGAALVAAGLAGARIAMATRRGGARLSLLGLASRNVGRRPGRTLLAVGLVASAAFLVLATSAFHAPPTEAGTGGFDVWLETDNPVFADLATEQGRREAGLGAAEERLLASATVVPFRTQSGEDASCQNLYQARQPRVLGAPPSFAESGERFVWAQAKPTGDASPWTLLEKPTAPGEPIPAVLDFNTAVYSLRLYGGVGSLMTIRDERGAERVLEVVGLVQGSILQGYVLTSERQFLRLFPSAAGARTFLVRLGPTGEAPGASASRAAPVCAALEDRLADFGADATPTARRLAELLAVQNTYLATFQALGALGLALGAVGLGVAQFRNLNQRRGELALLRAAGFAASRIRRMVLVENLLVLGGGLAMGAAAAAAALAPMAGAQGARPPWAAGLVLIAATAGIGLACARVAAARVLSAPVVRSLRGD